MAKEPTKICNYLKYLVTCLTSAPAPHSIIVLATQHTGITAGETLCSKLLRILGWILQIVKTNQRTLLEQSLGWPHKSPAHEATLRFHHWNICLSYIQPPVTTESSGSIQIIVGGKERSRLKNSALITPLSQLFLRIWWKLIYAPKYILHPAQDLQSPQRKSSINPVGSTQTTDKGYLL